MYNHRLALGFRFNDPMKRIVKVSRPHRTARDFVRQISKLYPNFPKDNLIGCSIQQLHNLYDSLLGRTPKLWSN